MTHASLFSGIGGAEIAASWLGWQNLFHCEIQELQRKVLAYWFPESISYEVIPNKVCPKCGKKAADDYRPLATKYPDEMTV